MTMTGLEGDVATAYRNFATHEARGNSPLYEAVCLRIAEDSALLTLIGALPAQKRQPNLVLGAARYLGAPTDDASNFGEWLIEHWDAVRAVALERATQTNEVGRCATLLPFLANVARSHAPAGRGVALLEVGCSAGLALFPDLYDYEYAVDGGERCFVESDVVRRAGAGAVPLRCAVSPAAATRVQQMRSTPAIAWRGGLDLNPLDVISSTQTARENARWLQALVWPGQDERAARLDAAMAAVRERVEACPQEAPDVVAGDVIDDLDRLVRRVPEDLHLVLFHSAVLAYVDDERRQAFEARMADLAERAGGFTWMSNEAPSVMPGVRAALDGRDIVIPPGRFVLAVDGAPSAVTGPHGQTLDLLQPDAAR